MKKFLLSIILALSVAPFFEAYPQQDDKMFQYPSIPEDKTTLSERCNYLVFHFWDRCNIKQSYSFPDKLSQSFGDWISFMPYATADTVHLAIDNYIASVEKTGQDNVLKMAKMADQWLYCDTAPYQSEELYLPFCTAAGNFKKMPKAEKAIYQAQARKISNSMVGATAPDFSFTSPDGATQNFKDIVASRIILFFYDPDCLDCSLAKARLSADYNLQKLIDMQLVKVVAIYNGSPSQQWKESASTMPDGWVVGAAEDIDLDFDIIDIPDMYYLNARHKIIGKHIDLDNLLLAVMQINQQMNN